MANGFAERIINAYTAGQGAARQRKMDEMKDQVLEFGQTYLDSPTSPEGQQAFGQIARLDPEQAQTYQELAGQDRETLKAQYEQGQKQLQAVGKLAAGILSLPPDQQAEAYAQGREFLLKQMNGNPNMIPEQMDPDMLRGVAGLTGNEISTKPTTKLQHFTDAEGNVYNYDSSTGDFTPVPGVKGRGQPQKTIKVTSDGGIEITEGPAGEQALVPPKPVQNEAAKNLLAAETSVDKMDRIFDSYEPEFLTYAGKGKAFLGIEAEKLEGIPVIGETVGEIAKSLGADSEFVKKREVFRQQVEQEFNEYRRLITGAAASVQELDALRKSMFNSDMSPTQFQAAAEQYRSERQRIARISRRVLRDGFTMGEESFGKEVDKYFTGGLDDDPMTRGAELEAEGLGDDQIVQRLIDEGYIN